MKAHTKILDAFAQTVEFTLAQLWAREWRRRQYTQL
jgi:hypothetical protein